jgi:hypothetical protein
MAPAGGTVIGLTAAQHSDGALLVPQQGIPKLEKRE